MKQTRLIRPRRLPRRLAVVLTLCMVMAPLAVLPAPPARAAGCFPAGGAKMPEPPAASGAFVFSGHGWGHGIGMSQWGAQGAAKLGCSVNDILTTYYQGVKVASATMPERIRVGIVPNRPSGPLENSYKVTVTAGSVKWTLRETNPDTGEIREIAATQAAGATWQVDVQSDGSFIVRDPSIEPAPTPEPPEPTSEPTSEPNPDPAAPTPAQPEPDPGIMMEGGDGFSVLRASISGATVRLPREGHTYKRGALEFFPRKRQDAPADGMYVTLVIASTEDTSAMDAYLYGLAEVPSSWEPAALQAQAVVGRSYALAQWEAYRGNRSDCRCDLFDTTSSQHYTAFDKEGERTYGVRWVDAVNATSGRVMTYGDKTAVGFYASSHGGHSETNSFVWNGPQISYLQPVDDSRWDRSSGNPNQAWSVGFSAAEVTAKLAAAKVDVGDVQAISLPAPKGVSGRVGDPTRSVGGVRAGGVLIQGTEGSTRISGNLLRTALGLRSTLVRVSSDLACAVPAGVDIDALGPRRIAGTNRVETAVALSQANWSASTTAVIAAAGTFPDALAGGPLAASLDAPILLTGADELPVSVAQELKRLGATEVRVLGGPVAISDDVMEQLSALGDDITVERLWGADRWETAQTVATEVGPSSAGEVLLALGGHEDPARAWPDAVAAGAVQAGESDVPLLLTTRTQLPDATRDALVELRAAGATTVLIVGGEVAVSEDVTDEVEALGLDVERLAGEDRFATSAAAAAAGLARGGDPTQLLVATAAAFPDALSAAAVAARSGAPLLLVDSCDIARRRGTVEWLDEHNGLTDITVVGGTNAIGERVRWQFDQRLGG